FWPLSQAGSGVPGEARAHRPALRPDAEGTIASPSGPNRPRGYFVRGGTEPVRAGLRQFLPVAVTIEHAERAQPVVSRADDVMAAVADHHCRRGIHTRCPKRVLQQLGLVDAGAVQLRAEHVLEIRAQLEVLDDAAGIDMRLAGRDK